jgi:hypothetical protein
MCTPKAATRASKTRIWIHIYLQFEFSQVVEFKFMPFFNRNFYNFSGAR